MICDNGPTFFSANAPENNERILQLLINAGADVNAQNANPVMVAAQDGCAANLKILLKNGASMNKTGFEGDTALMAATRKGHTEVVAMLLNHGALVLVKDKCGRSALIWAAECQQYAICDLLVERMLELPNYYIRKQIITFLSCVKKCYGQYIYRYLKNPKYFAHLIKEANEEQPSNSVAYKEIQDLVAKNPRNCPNSYYSARDALNKKYFGKKEDNSVI